MSDENTELNNEKIEAGNLYEVGFHVLPNLTEEEAVAELTNVTAVIEKNGGVVKKTHNPQMRELSYEMVKLISGKKQYFANAYFGHVVFNIEPNLVQKMSKEIEVLPNILRALTLEITPESLLPREQRTPQTTREEPKPASEEKPETVVPPMSEAELDKTIEALVIN